MSRDELMDKYFEAVHDVSYWIDSGTNLATYFQGHANAIAGVMHSAKHITIDEFRSMFLLPEDLR